MSIKLRLEKGAIVMQAVLEDAAFTELLTLIQKHESQDAAPIQAAPHAAIPASPTSEPAADSRGIKPWLAMRTAAEVLNGIGWQKNTEKILLMGAHLEAKGGSEGWKSSDMVTKFGEAKEPFPGNFARDIANAVKDGFVATITPRTYTISRSGWNRISDAISKLPAI